MLTALRYTALTAITGAALCFLPGTSHADFLYNNLGNAPGTVLGAFPIGSVGPEGNSFSTGATGFLLTNVILALQGDNDAASFAISLYSDNSTACAPGPSCSGGPGALLDTIVTASDNSLSTILTDVDFTLATAYPLAAATRYWVIASSTDNSSTLWSYTQDLSGSGVAGEFNITHRGAQGGPIPSTNDFTTYPSCSNGDFGPVGQNACTPYQMAVAGAPVPEPASWLLFSTALTVFRFRRWGRKPTAAPGGVCPVVV